MSDRVGRFKINGVIIKAHPNVARQILKDLIARAALAKARGET